MKNIKKLYYAVAIAIMALGFTACTQDEDTAPTLKGQEINTTFSVGSVQTRVNTLGTGDSWEDGDQLKVKASTEYNSCGPTVLSFDAKTNKWSRSRDFHWLSEDSEHTILAVYPSTAEYDTYALPTDQSTIAKLKAADLITGYTRCSPYGVDTVSVPMNHRMSMVTVTYEVGTADYPDMDISEPQVYSKYAGATFSNVLVMSKPATTTSTWVTAYKHDTNKFSAIVIPGSYSAGDVFLKLKVGDKSFSVKLWSATEFKEGYRYEYKVKVGENKVELTEINAGTFDGWTTEEDLN